MKIVLVFVLLFGSAESFAQQSIVDDNGHPISLTYSLSPIAIPGIIDGWLYQSCGDFFAAVYNAGSRTCYAIQIHYGGGAGEDLRVFSRDIFEFVLDEAASDSPRVKFIFAPGVAFQVDKIAVFLSRSLYQQAWCLPERADIQR